MKSNRFPHSIRGIAALAIASMFGRAKNMVISGKKLVEYSKNPNDISVEKQVANILGHSAADKFLDRIGAPSLATRIQYARDISMGAIDPQQIGITDVRWKKAFLEFGDRYFDIEAARSVVKGDIFKNPEQFQLVGFRQMMVFEAQNKGVNVYDLNYVGVDEKLVARISLRLKEVMGNYAAFYESAGTEIVQQVNDRS